MNKLLLCSLLISLPLITQARDYVPFSERYGQYANEPDEKAFSESPVVLPDYPIANQSSWQALYINETYPNQVAVLKPVERTEDGSIRYTLSIQASNGVPNLSYEAIRCAGRFYKAFAFGDNSSQRWITPRQNAWQEMDSYFLANRPIRARLYRLFCEDGTPRNSEEANQRLEALSGKH